MRPVGAVGLEGAAHGERIAGEVEVVGLGRGGDKGLDFGEGVGRRNVDGLQRRWRGRRCEDEDEQHETIFAAVVREGELLGTSG